MVLTEANPLPEVCQKCEAEKWERDCGSCEYGGLRFTISEVDSLRASRKALLRRMERDGERVIEIERKLQELGETYQRKKREPFSSLFSFTVPTP